MRLAYYAGASTAAAAACLLKAFHERPNFYSATVYLSQSNACLLILTNLLMVLSCSFMFVLQRLLYGPLRPIEIEQLSEKAWYAVLDTLLAMPSFREDVGGWLLAMFTLLLAGKVWGWIGEGRVDILEQQPPANPTLFHVRLATSLVLSVVFDIWMLDYCIDTVLADPRPGMMVIFTFEFAILSIFSTFTLARYVLTGIQARVEKVQMQRAIDDRKTEIRAERAAARQNEAQEGQSTARASPQDEPIEVDENEVDVPGWEDKRRYLFALELLTDFIKLLIYIVFFTVSVTFNGLPMHIMRDVYMTFASFSKRVADYLAYRKATSDMNTRYPDASTEDIRGDACIVCRETMVAWEQPDAQGQAQPAGEQPAAAPAPGRRRDEGLRAKKLPCGHILHLRCLKAWLERQQVCPTCRRPVVGATSQGQPGGPGAAHGAGGQPGAQQAGRQGRARIFNLGPVRIGFLNGPRDQIGNIVRQMQNPQAAAGQNAGQDNNQGGPNHLGLRAPYAAGAGGTGAAGTSSRATVPTSVQLMQLEQRLVQEAHNLDLEMQQLTTLRLMEAELARLRGLQQPLQAPVGTERSAEARQAGIQAGIQAGRRPQGDGMHGSHFPLPFQQPLMGYETVHGSPAQRYGNGHEHLPPGMVLPEGWTVMPLQRGEVGSASGASTTQRTEMQAGSATPEQTASSRMGGASAQSANPMTARAAPQASANTQTNGPTDDSGSPLFVPAQAAAPPAPETTPAATREPDPSTSEQAGGRDRPESQLPRESQLPPWNLEDWSFDERANGPTANREPSQTVASQNGDLSLAQAGGSKSSDSGQSKAVKVEDAPDERD